ncbi:MAG: hypothetical protein ACI8TA_000729 [Cyclobacteriaceae bacterium]|jgi:hypothetical protein
MDKKRDTLFFIPDISGFTDFVNHTEISHSKHIISELLEGVMSKNVLGFELVEIEGDALYYYKKGNLPTLSKILDQAKEMFLSFHQQLLLYKHQRLCECGACTTAIDLSLKFVIHAGKSELLAVGGGVPKPFGKDVILSHKLLKNRYAGNQYMLLTDSFEDEAIPDWFSKVPEEQTTDGEGNKLFFRDLSAMLDEIKFVPEKLIDDRTDNPVVYEGLIQAGSKEVFELISNLDHQPKWKTKVERMEYKENHVNRAGEKHLCYVDGKVLTLESVGGDFGEGVQVFGEKTTDVPVLESVTTYFILESKAEKTHLRIEAHLKAKSFLAKLVSPLIRGKVKKILMENLDSIKSAAEHELLAFA